MSIYADAFKQFFFIPAPTLTEKNLPDQSGRVHIVTGGYAGCGKELSKILYEKNAVVYIAGRSQEKFDNAVDEIKQTHPSSDGRLEFLKVDLADLSSIKPGVEGFLKFGPCRGKFQNESSIGLVRQSAPKKYLADHLTAPPGMTVVKPIF